MFLCDSQLGKERHLCKLYTNNCPPPLSCFGLNYCGNLGFKDCVTSLETFLFSDFSGYFLDFLHFLR